MPVSYSSQRVREALTATRGNHKKACQLLLAQAKDDQQLLMQLTAPYLEGIIAQAVERTSEGKDVAAVKARPEKPQSINIPLDEFGRNLLSALRGKNAGTFGQEDQKILGKGPKAASRQHEDTLRRMASQTNGKPKK